MQYRDARGETHLILANGSSMVDADGQMKGAVVVWRDVTEREQQEMQLVATNGALRRSEAVLDAFFAASPVLLVLLDEDMRSIKTDMQTPGYFGLDRYSITGREVKDLMPGLFRETGALMRQVIETGQPLANVEVEAEMPGRPGETVYWRGSYFPVPLPNGKSGLGVIAMDVTGYKKIEKMLLNCQAELEACEASE